jgi:glucose/arabinose dehydrogenase
MDRSSKWSLSILCLVFTLILFSCKDKPETSSDVPQTSAVANTGVETLPAEAEGQKPAFVGQTRIQAIQTSSKYRVDTLAKNLERPWGFTFLPDGRYLITEKPGRIRILAKDGSVGDTIVGVLPVHFQQDGGLMDIAIAPDFSNTRQIFWAYSEKRDTGYMPTIATGYLAKDEKSLERVSVIYRAGPAIGSVMHYGTTLLFDPEGYLLVTLGERYEPRVRVRAQALHSPFGKVIRIDRNGNAAPGNPFKASQDTLAEIWAYGFRDPQGIAFHPQTGELWLSDHGPRAGDEINVITPGANYGWPMIAYGLEYSKEPVNGGLTQADGMEQPVYYWDPAVAPAGITFYSGRLIPEWRNDLFVATLRGKHLVRLKIEGHKIVGEERLLTDLDKRLRGVKEGPDGALYVWTAEAEGYILRITNDE